MKKLFLTIILCFTCIALTYAQPKKGGITLSGDYTFMKYENIKASHAGFFGVEYFIHDNLSLGIGVSYNEYWRYGLQVNYFVPIRNSKVYFSLLNFISYGKEYDEFKPVVSITPAFNYDFAPHWTIYSSIATFELGFNPTYYNLNVNLPRVGFLYSF